MSITPEALTGDLRSLHQDFGQQVSVSGSGLVRNITGFFLENREILGELGIDVGENIKVFSTPENLDIASVLSLGRDSWSIRQKTSKEGNFYYTLALV